MKVTINPAQPSNDDIFKPGTLVIDPKDGSVVLVCKSDEILRDCEFTGVAINSVSLFCSGYLEPKFQKKHFVKFVGNVILEQA